MRNKGLCHQEAFRLNTSTKDWLRDYEKKKQVAYIRNRQLDQTGFESGEAQLEVSKNDQSMQLYSNRLSNTIGQAFYNLNKTITRPIKDEANDNIRWISKKFRKTQPMSTVNVKSKNLDNFASQGLHSNTHVSEASMDFSPPGTKKKGYGFGTRGASMDQKKNYNGFNLKDLLPSVKDYQMQEAMKHIRL